MFLLRSTIRLNPHFLISISLTSMLQCKHQMFLSTSRSGAWPVIRWCRTTGQRLLWWWRWWRRPSYTTSHHCSTTGSYDRIFNGQCCPESCCRRRFLEVRFNFCLVFFLCLHNFNPATTGYISNQTKFIATHLKAVDFQDFQEKQTITENMIPG